MTAAERATALLEGREIDCPRCGVAPMRQQPTVDLGSLGGRVEGRMVCDNCGLVCSRALCAVSGQPGDETAALHLQPGRRAMSGDGPLVWERDGWVHRLEPEGHRWRWQATHNREVHDFGLFPGGAYVAIQRLLHDNPEAHASDAIFDDIEEERAV